MAPARPESIKPTWFQILLALSETDLHGFGIQRAVREQSDGELHLWPATLYGSLEAMCGRGWIEELTDPDERPAASEKRRYYRLTAAGRAVLSSEADRLAQLARLARTRIDERSTV